MDTERVITGIFIALIVAWITIMMFAIVCYGASIQFGWDANTETDIAGYRLYQSAAPGDYFLADGTFDPNMCVVTVGTITTCIQRNVAQGTHYWVLSAYDTFGNESGPSNEVTYTVDRISPDDPNNLQIFFVMP